MASSAQLKAQLNDFINSLFVMNYLGEQFKQVQRLEVGSTMAEIINLFCGEAESTLSELSALLSEPTVDFGDAKEHVHKLKGSCITIGAKKVILMCNNFRNVCQENNKEGCIAALHEIKREFNELREKFQTIIQLEQQIRDLGSN